MAARRLRPGRTLVIFFLGVAVLFGLVALAGSWKPQLGLDLQGGTRISLKAAEGQESPSEENLEEARRIIEQRVNGGGVTEAEVTTQGGDRVVVEVPGDSENRRELEEMVKRTAQLRFRLVACSEGGTGPCASGGVPTLRPTPFAADNTDPTDSPSEKPSKKPGDGAATDEPTGTATEEPTEGAEESGDKWMTTEETIQWINTASPESIAAYNAVTCDQQGDLVTQDGKPATETTDPKLKPYVTDIPSEPLVACWVRDGQAAKFLLSPSVIEGTELTDASAGIPQNDVQWVVNIEMGNDPDKAMPPGSTGAEDDFETVSSAFVGDDTKQFAIVLDGKILSPPTMEAVIYDGRSQITGDFTETEATNLANSLKFGALPIEFEDDPFVEEIGPSLAGNQLSAGLLAGGIGLGLVMLYCLLYYRMLGTVVVWSLFVAAGITYGMVLLLGETAGFTLTLPGIAGLIIAVGITADSFVIYFERIRDEMREGKSMRVAVETGWARARVTRVAANTVSILSALVLYIFATGAVKGFGFALGLSTLIDLAVLFWFTKPALSWLGQFRIFNSGHRYSGLSPETLGIDAPVAQKVATAGGNA